MGLASRSVKLHTKRFYIDVLENTKQNTHFVKIAESRADGRRSQIHLPIQLAIGLRDCLEKFEGFCEKYDASKEENVKADDSGKDYLMSKTVMEDRRRYFLDLVKTAKGGLLLRITQIAGKGMRYSIGVPADGIKDIRVALAEVLEEHGVKELSAQELPEAKHIRVGNKMFHFDVGKNYRGLFMRISEVNTTFRDSITIPLQCWSKFRDIIDEFVDEVAEGGSPGSSSERGSESDAGDSVAK